MELIPLDLPSSEAKTMIVRNSKLSPVIFIPVTQGHDNNYSNIRTRYWRWTLIRLVMKRSCPNKPNGKRATVPELKDFWRWPLELIIDMFKPPGG